MLPIVSALKSGNVKTVLGRLKGKLEAKKFDKKYKPSKSAVAIEYSHKYTVRLLPEITKKHYDAAISFLTPHYFVAQKIDADKKISWIHTDYSTIDVDIESELEMWSRYDNIVSISDDVTKAFLTKFPSLKDNIVLIENILSKSFIDEQAKLLDVKSEMPDGCVKLLSIGRFCEAKNFDNVPEIASIMKAKGVDFKWYIIGYGADEALIRAKIAEFGMQDTVIILGKKDNPYPYIAACDIYVQPSRYEGKAVTVHEAQILNKPIVITNYATSHSQLTNGFDGLIVPMDNEGCANALAEFINNKDMQNQFAENMQTVNYSNESEINKLYDIIKE